MNGKKKNKNKKTNPNIVHAVVDTNNIRDLDLIICV